MRLNFFKINDWTNSYFPVTCFAVCNYRIFMFFKFLIDLENYYKETIFQELFENFYYQFK